MPNERIIGELVADMRTVKDTVKEFDSKLDAIIARENQWKGAKKAWLFIGAGISTTFGFLGAHLNEFVMWMRS